MKVVACCGDWIVHCLVLVAVVHVVAVVVVVRVVVVVAVAVVLTVRSAKKVPIGQKLGH